MSNSSSFTPSSVGGVSYGHILGFRDFFSYRHIASYEPNSGKVLRSLIESFEILAERADVVMEDRTLRVSVMVFCQDHLFLCVGAAYGRAIAVAALDHLSWSRRTESRLFYGDASCRKAALSRLRKARWRTVSVR